MQRYKIMIVAATVALALGALPAVAQQPQPSTPQSSTAEGQLTKVDTTAKTISIRTAAEAQMLFRYDDSTKVTGSDENVAGLATQSGTDVKVTYVKDGKDNVATEIAVQKKPA